MFDRFEEIPEKKLAGKKLVMSLIENKTGLLWKEFMQSRKTITNAKDHFLYSLQVYPENYFKNFNPSNSFTKWALCEVTDHNNIPDGMESFVLPGGSYAVFIHKGPASEGPKVFQHIYSEWLPLSGYQLDQRPHFEKLGEKYKNDTPDSEEEIWIPVSSK